MPRTVLKKGQMQITESMIAVILIMIVGAIMLIFFFNKAKAEFKVQLSEYDSLDAMQTAQVVTSMDELTCEGTSNICFDKYKVEAFKTLWDDDKSIMLTYYYELFKESRITITVYELDQDGNLAIDEHDLDGDGTDDKDENNDVITYPRTYTLYENTPAESDAPREYTSIPVTLPIYLKNSANGASDFAILSIERYHQATGNYEPVTP